MHQPTAAVPASLVRDDPLVEVVVPVLNEAHVLPTNIRLLRAYLDDYFPLPSVVTIVDNGSDEGTWAAAEQLAVSVPGVKALRLDQSGRGRALRAAWSASQAPVVAYMDVDLSTGLSALLPLVAPLLSGHSDVAIGSRLASGARVKRSQRRELISRAYNRILRSVLRLDMTDAQCGFKAVRRDVVLRLLPAVYDNGWFFDTELLAVAENRGLRIHEVPVDWIEDTDSRVRILDTAWRDLCGVARLARSGVFGRPRAATDAGAGACPSLDRI